MHQHKFSWVHNTLTTLCSVQWLLGFRFISTSDLMMIIPSFLVQGYNMPTPSKATTPTLSDWMFCFQTFHPRNNCCILGTHSNHKHAVIEAQSSACLKDEVDHWGYWKSNKCQQNTYASMTIHYVDATGGAKLCMGGAKTNQNINGSGIWHHKWLNFATWCSKHA